MAHFRRLQLSLKDEKGMMKRVKAVESLKPVKQEMETALGETAGMRPER